MLGADTLELAHIDYSFKPVKPIVVFEQPILEQALLMTIPPLFYGAMPNLGLYSQPDGPCPNPGDLLPRGKIAEAIASYEEQIEHAVKGMVYVASHMYEAGADGINFDTTAAAGDAEFLATLQAIEILKDKYPRIYIQMGMAVAHGIASGIGGIRAAGDLVARMQVSRGMRIKEAKEYVAGKLGISVDEIADPVVMSELREDHDLGRVNAVPGAAKGIDAKFRIAELLDIEINCVNKFRERTGG